MAKKKPENITPTKAFRDEMNSLLHRHQTWRVFADFCEMGALSLANVITKDADRERRYLDIVKRYEPEEVAVFPRMLGQVTLGLQNGDDDDNPTTEPDTPDFLGAAFMDLDLGSHWHGQFFTPIHVCRLMAEMTLHDGVEEIIETHGYVKVMEPAAGAGAMVIAVSDALRRRGLNPQRQMHVTAVDVDPTAAYMAFIQLSLLHIPAIVVLGNSLSLEEREVLKTPAHYLGWWDTKLRRRETAEESTPEPEAPEVGPEPEALPQLKLF